MRMKSKTLTEHEEQVSLLSQKGCHPMLYSIPNGARTSISVAKRLKAEGLKKGVPDLILPIARLGYHSLYIEMKRHKPRGTTSKEQKVWHKALAKEGHLVYVCYGGEAAWTVLNNYINSKLTPEGKDWKKVYQYAMENNFRFLSYGDSSILFPK